jgi:putative two-component system response regulator
MFKNRANTNNTEIADVLFKMANLCEMHEWDNRKHLERINKYAFLVTSSLGFDIEEANTMSIACILHDVGKIYTPKELLITKNELRPEDWKLIEEHTLQGAAILDSTSSLILQTGATIALSHHERWDGSGYPRKLKGRDIPMGGRICAVVDVFDALTTRRSYKGIIPEEEALRLLKENSGVLFDPEVIKAIEKTFPEIQRVKFSLEV